MKKIILIVIILLCTSCYDYKELNDINIIDSIAVDYIDNEYVVYLNVIDSDKEDYLISGHNKNISLAFNDALNNSLKEPFLEHLKLLILSEELCKNGINDVIEYTFHDLFISNNYKIATSKDILNLYNMKKDNIQVSERINGLINRTNKSFDVEVMINNLTSKRKDIALPLISLDNDNIYINEIGYFSDGKLINYYNSKIYNFLVLDMNSISFDYQDNVVNIYKKDISYDILKDKIIVNINGYGEIKEINNSSYDDLTIYITQIAKKEIELFLNKTLEDNCDLVGFKDLYYKRFNKELKVVNYDINISLTVNKIGSILGGINDQ